VRSQNPKDFEHWLSQRLWVKFAMFLLNSTSVDAGAIIGGEFSNANLKRQFHLIKIFTILMNNFILFIFS